MKTNPAEPNGSSPVRVHHSMFSHRNPSSACNTVCAPTEALEVAGRKLINAIPVKNNALNLCQTNLNHPAGMLGAPGLNVPFILFLLLSALPQATGAPGPELRAVRDQGYLNLSWDPLDAKLQEALTLTGPWQTVNTAAVNSCRYRMTGARKFFRLTQPPLGKKWLTLAAVTMHPVPNTETNLATMFARMTEAAARGADLLVFPEQALQQCPPWAEDMRTPTAAEMNYVSNTAETVPGPSTDRLVAKAAELRMHVVCGMTEKDAAGRIYNAAVFLGPAGVLGCHRKSIHVANDSLIWSRGTNLIQVFDSPIGAAGIMICAEMGGESLSEATAPGPRLAAAGADFLVTSSAWWNSIANLWDLATTMNASKAARWHVVANAVGTIGYAQCYGHSRIVDPRGIVIRDSGVTEALVVLATDILIDAPPANNLLRKSIIK